MWATPWWSFQITIVDLDHDDPFIDLCQAIPFSKKLGKELIMGYFNARLCKYQNIIEKSKENIMNPFLLCCYDMVCAMDKNPLL